MASSSSHRNEEGNAFFGIEPPGKRRRVCESSGFFDVFINHRGPDVKQTLATQLYNSLEQLGIRTFLDSQEKELGNSFTSTIETAIRSASVHIAIFSKGYAESPWCLAELVLMLQSNAKIIPLFYHVKPSDLRRIENGVYAEAFINYEKKGRYLEKLNEWKEALHSLSFIAGEEFESFSDTDCQKIVAAVQKEIQRKTCLRVADRPVGLDNLVEDFEKRCFDELVQDFENQCRLEEGKHQGKVVGIFGMGGVGKTTLAKELFNRKKMSYSRASFLFDVREAFVRSELPFLQQKLLKDLFGKDFNFRIIEEGTSYLKEHLERNPLVSFLVVVDDIDHVEQLDALRVMDILDKTCNSLVIVTTRDAGVLITAEITVGYNLRGMDKNCGRELFCWHAFGQSHPGTGYEQLVDSFVKFCEGLPLSLQVLGRHVHGRNVDYWNLELIKVSKMLPRDVKQRLKISFDALDAVEKQIFMDIACFFIDKSKSMAEIVWGGSGWNAHHALVTLKDKCLVEEIKIRDYDKVAIGLRMHDHLRDLGRELALELNPPHRLWRPQDLKSLELTSFKTILAKTNFRCFLSIFDESLVSRVTFFLGQSDICFETSASLVWLQLEGNSTEQTSIASWIPLQNLHCLKIYGGRFETLWENNVQAPSQLKKLHIFRTILKELPSLSGLSCLEKIKIENCENLQNITLPTTLIKLIVRSCSYLQKVAATGDLTKLRKLIIRWCPKLEELPSLSRISCLEKIGICMCEKLQNISGIDELHASEHMELYFCSNAVIRNCILKLKSAPLDIFVVGRAVDGAESTLNEYLFSEADIGADAVTQLPSFSFSFSQEDCPEMSELSAVIVCMLVVFDDPTSNKSVFTDDDDFGYAQGEWIITSTISKRWSSYRSNRWSSRRSVIEFDLILDRLLKSSGTPRIMKKKVFQVKLKKDEECKKAGVLRTIIDRLHHL